MRSGRRPPAPRHLAGVAPRRPVEPGTGRTAPARHLRLPAPVAEVPVVELDEVTPLARVQRSRLAFAVSATVAAVPVLVIDNLPATAAPDEVETAAAVEEAGDAAERAATSLADDPTTTTVVVTVEEAPAEEVTTTEVVETTTSEAAATTTEAAPETTSQAPVAALRAPAPTAPPTTQPPTTTTAPVPEEESGYAYGDPADPATWDRLAQCEAHGNWALNTGNGYYGGLQFSLTTWQAVGGSGYPHEASREEQIRRGQILQARYGWGQWPHCSAKLGYR